MAVLVLLTGLAVTAAAQSPAFEGRFELTTIEAPKGVRAFAVGAGTAWFLSKDALFKVEARGDRVVAVAIEKGKWEGAFPPASGGDYGPPMAVGEGSVWLVGAAHNVEGIHRIDAATGECIATIPITKHRAEVSLSYFDGSLWLLDHSDRTVQRIDPGSNRITSTLELGKGYWTSMVAGEGALWSIDTERGLVKRVDPRSNTVMDEFSVGAPQRNGFLDASLGRDGQYSLAAGEGTLWIASVRTLDVAKDRLFRMDPKTHEHVSTVRSITSFFGAPAFWNGLAWVRNGGYPRTGYYIAAVAPKNNAIEGEFLLPNTYKQDMPPIVLADEDSLWIYTGRMVARIRPTQKH